MVYDKSTYGIDKDIEMKLLEDLKDLVNQLSGGKITEQTAIKTLGSLHEYYTIHEIHLKTNNTGLNILQLAMDHFLEHLQDCICKICHHKSDEKFLPYNI